MKENAGLEWRARLTLLLGKGVLHALARTWRFRVLNEASLIALRASGKPFIYSLWHGHLLPLLWHHRGSNVAILISEHRDGELIARAAESLGYRLIRGSTTRGAERALLSLVRELKEGRQVAITPDGPKGPARTFAPGALIAAQRSGAAILPVAAGADRAWRLGSWDRFIIPKPFARVTVAYGAPTTIDAASARAAAHEGPRVEALMKTAAELAGD
ncbi:MAG TPA: lysophospholipid acyltransferase family protein [Gemmatimonadaceae bacterium]|nr:lysophospholipid acyltransferase family protein [Gemmatimonadaceae bacterium]